MESSGQASSPSRSPDQRVSGFALPTHAQEAKKKRPLEAQESQGTFQSPRKSILASSQLENLPSPTMSSAPSDIDEENDSHAAQLSSVAGIIRSYESLSSDEVKSFLLSQLVKRTDHTALQLCSSMLFPFRKRDFVEIIPVELSLLVFSYLDVRSLGRSARVSKRWHHIIESEQADRVIWRHRVAEEGWIEPDSTQNSLPTDPVAMEINSPKRPSNKENFKDRYVTRNNWLQSKYEHYAFQAHGSSVVTCLQFDSERIVTGSDDRVIHVYETKTGKLLHKLEGHTGGVWCLEYWKHIAVSGGTDRTVRVWDLETGRCTHIFYGHVSTVRCLMILPPTETSEALIITGSRDSTLRVWRLPDPRRSVVSDADEYVPERPNPYLKHVLTGHVSSVRAIAAENETIISGSYDGTVRVWNVKSGGIQHVLRGHTEKVYSVGYSDSLGRCASGSMDATVRIWCTKSGMQLFLLEGHTSLVGLLELSTQYLVSGAADSTLRIWCPLTGRCLAHLVGHVGAITCFHHDAANNTIVSGSEGGIRVWEVNSFGAQYVSRPDKHYHTTHYAKSIKEIPGSYFSVVQRMNMSFGDVCGQSPRGLVPVYGRHVAEYLGEITGVWRVRSNRTHIVSAVQRNGMTWIEVIDFTRDGDRARCVVRNEGDADVDVDISDDDDEAFQNADAMVL